MLVMRRFAALWLFGWCAAFCHSQQPTPAEQAREVLRTWEQISNPAPTVRVRLTTTYERWVDGKFVPNRQVHNTYRRSPTGFAAFVRTETIDEHGVRKAEGSQGALCNHQYESRLSSSKENEWRIEEMGSSTLANPAAPSVAGSGIMFAVDSVIPWVRLDGYVNFYRLLHDPRCAITKCERSPDGGQRFYFVINTDMIPPTENKILTKNVIFFHGNIKGGWFETSGKYYRVDRYDVESITLPKKVDTFHQIGQVEYFSGDRFPIPQVKSDMYETPAIQLPNGTTVRVRTTREYEVEYPPSGDDREYYLSHYGLPEPEGVTPPRKPIPLYVWLLIGAGGFALIALVCRWLLRRRSAKSVPVAPPPAA